MDEVAKIGIEKSTKSTKERRPTARRSKFLVSAPILFRIGENRSGRRTNWNEAAQIEQPVWCRQNSRCSEKRSGRRTNLAEEAEMEQLVKWRRREAGIAALSIEIKLSTFRGFGEVSSKE